MHAKRDQQDKPSKDVKIAQNHKRKITCYMAIIICIANLILIIRPIKNFQFSLLSILESTFIFCLSSLELCITINELIEIYIEEQKKIDMANRYVYSFHSSFYYW